MFVIGSNSASTGYNLTRSLRFRASASATLSKTFATSSDQKTFTISDWLKRGALDIDATFFASVTDANNFLIIYYQASTNKIIILGFSGGSAVINISTSAVFRDPSAWYHIVIAFDTTQATGSNRVKMYVNNTQQAVTFTTTPSLNLNALPSTTRYIGRAETAAAYFDGYLAEVNFIDGQALTPSSFGSTNSLTGVWQPARYTGSYGTNGFYLPFTDNSALTTSSNVGLGKDFSGNGNYWTTNNISITAGVTYDSMTDVPTLTSATASNYCVMNPLCGNSSMTLLNGNLNTSSTTNGVQRYGTIGVSSGKWYWESSPTALSGGGNGMTLGISNNIQETGATFTGNRGYFNNDGKAYTGSTGVAYGATWTTNDIIGMALDLNSGTLTFYKNNVSQGVAFTGLTGEWFPLIRTDATANSFINFGQRPFTYTPPTGFVALNTYNLPTSTIVKGNTVMDATLWTGDGTSPRTITNAAPFQPDLVWFKSRSTTFYNQLSDSVRGATKSIYSNVTNAEENNAINGYLSSINSNGFSVINGSSSGGSVNANGTTYVAWQWQAGQGSTSSNTNGTITSTVSVNASAGFSVVTYTGTGANATVGHGLGVAPQMIIIKKRSSTGNWITYHASVALNGSSFVALNSSAAAVTMSAQFNNTAPTSSVFTVGTDADTNGNTQTFVAYCWTPIAGFSAFGSYTGNGSTDGTFVYTGFRPKFVIIKRTDAVGDWYTFDSARDPYNATAQGLLPNSSASETTYTGWGDLLSNGFKIRRTDAAWNSSGGTYIYMAFAENPFKNALAR
jgi:hypothetical protein